MEADEKRNWDFKIKKYADGVKLEKQKIDAEKEIAVQYAKNKPKTI